MGLLDGRRWVIAIALGIAAWLVSVGCLLPAIPPGDDDDDDDASADDDDSTPGDDDDTTPADDDDTTPADDDDTTPTDDDDSTPGDDDDSTPGDDDDDDTGVPLDPGDTAVDAPAVALPIVLQGDTTALANDFEDPLACTGYTALGNDGVYKFPMTAGQTLTADLAYDDPLHDAVLYISRDPQNPDTLCDGGVDAEIDGTETLLFTAPAAGMYFLVVDAYSSYGDTFILDLGP